MSAVNLTAMVLPGGRLSCSANLKAVALSVLSPYLNQPCVFVPPQSSTVYPSFFASEVKDIASSADIQLLSTGVSPISTIWYSAMSPVLRYSLPLSGDSSTSNSLFLDIRLFTVPLSPRAGSLLISTRSSYAVSLSLVTYMVYRTLSPMYSAGTLLGSSFPDAWDSLLSIVSTEPEPKG